MASLLATAGPFVGVRSIADAPYIDASKYLNTARGGYIRDVGNASSWRSRPGFSNPNSGAPIAAGQRVRGAHSHVDPQTGTIYRFFAADGKLYRASADFATYTNVTPAGITIDINTRRVSFQSVGASLVVTDGVNRPWVASNFAGTPITGAYIDIDGAGGAWTTWGPPTVYQDSVFFIAQTVPGGSAVQSRVGIVWCEPNQPAVGYTQSGYANFWNLIETNTDPLYAILGTNSGLFLWRENAITVAAGTPSINFSSTATRDARGDALGTVSPWAVALYGGNVFFLDNRGRPWMMPLSGSPQPVWEQMNALTLTSAGLDPVNLSTRSVGSVVPELNLYLSAIPPIQGGQQPFAMSVFDGSSGSFNGQWSLEAGDGLDTLDVMLDANGAHVLCATTQGAVWILNSLNAGVWSDGATMVAQVTTGTVGYSADQLMFPDSFTFIVTSPDPIKVDVVTPYTVAEFTVTPIVVVGISQTISQYRAVLGWDGVGVRWVQFVVAPSTTPTKQFGLQRIEVFGTNGPAGPDDP